MSKIEVVIKSDWLHVYDNVLDKEYCKSIIDHQKKRLINQELEPVKIGGEDVNWRTSMQSFIPPNSDIDRLLNTKTFELTKITPSNYEETSVIRYKKGEEYKMHHDFAHPSEPNYKKEIIIKIWLKK